MWAIHVHDLLQKFMWCQAQNLAESKTTSCVCRHKLWPVLEWDNDRVGQCWICVSVGGYATVVVISLSICTYQIQLMHRDLLHGSCSLPPLIYFLAQSSSKNLHGTKFFVNLWYASFRSGEFVRQRTPLYMGTSRRDSGIVAYEHTSHSPQAIK